jgi:hypothetical protein
MLNYVLVGMVVVIISMASWANMLRIENNRFRLNEGIYKTQLQELGSTIESKDRDLDMCSKRTLELKAESDKRAEAAKKAQEEAKKKGVENLKLADKLLSMNRPSGVTVCDNAERIINEYITNRQITTP